MNVIMVRYSLFILLTLVSVSAPEVESSHPVLQRTVEAIFGERSANIYPGVCKWLRASPRQTKMCKNDPGLAEVISLAKTQAIKACEETFNYDRWNCSLFYNNKPKRSIFKHIFRETAFIYALTAASFSHAIAKACSSGKLVRCSCLRGKIGKGTSWQWKRAGCGDDFKYGKRITRNFLDLKHAGNDQIAEVLKQNVQVGLDSIGGQLREVCKCYGFSGSCTTKTCWKRLGPFNSAMGLLKKHYHHAVKKKFVNYTTKRAVPEKKKQLMNLERKGLVYLQRTPNLCVSTEGRECRDHTNCATLCCGRGYNTSQREIDIPCNHRLVKYRYVKWDTCRKQMICHVCK